MAIGTYDLASFDLFFDFLFTMTKQLSNFAVELRFDVIKFQRTRMLVVFAIGASVF